MVVRINGGQGLAVVGAVALIVSLSLDWFEPGNNAWKVFEIVDLLLAALAVAALVIAIGAALAPDGPLAAGSSRWLTAAGAAALVLVAEALINHPPAAIGKESETGAWIALAGAGALTLGGVLSATRVALVITPRPREQAGESGAQSPAAAKSDEPEAYADTADEDYGDEYAETEYVDAEEAGDDYEEPEPTSEVPTVEEEAPPTREDERG
jgi:hypothetical protein